MKSLIIGASGFIGNSLYQLLRMFNKNVIGSYYSHPKQGLIKTDMTSKRDLNKIYEKYKPDIIYMPAFIPGVDYCELNDDVNKININGVRNVVDLCKRTDSKLVFFSSDYIFDGLNGPYLETDQPNPINKYGKIKLSCEKMVQELKKFLIIRTTVVYGYEKNSKNFLMTFTRDLKKGLQKKVPNDQLGSPTHIVDLSKITIELVQKNKNGIYNVAGPDYCSRYIFALKIARILGLKENLIKPVETKDLNQAAKRPLKAGLIIDKIRAEINVKPLGIDIALNELINLFKMN
ncbi:MAG: SDR family oxidoreductase [Promethearchaeota archaeon]